MTEDDASGLGRSRDGPGRGGPALDRRTVLLATAGMAGLAGCGSSGGGGSTEEAATTASADTGGGGETEESDGGQTTTTTAASSSPADCPMLTGATASYDTGETPLPVDFEYPAAMEGSWTYQNPDNWSASNTILARIERGSDEDGDGDIRMALGVRYAANSPGERDAWYDEAQAESLTTTDFNGESVEFLVVHPGGPYAGEHNGWQARAYLPYQPDNLATTAYFQAVLTVETLLFRADATDVTEACGENQRAALAATAESFSLNDATTFDQYVE